MFVFGVRDRDGLWIAVLLIATWVFSPFLVLHATTAISVLAILFSLVWTIHGAWRLLALGDALTFNNRVAQEFAFPSSLRTERLNFLLHTAILVFCFLPSATLLVLKPPSLAEPETRMAASIWLMVGHLGVIGLAFQGFRKIVTRG